MEVSDAALALLAKAGFDPVYGARPLKRAIQQKIENPLAQKILAGDFSSGEVVNIDVEDGMLCFNH
jgi:ATP-dependent Clp protease ATP-binding subunit ClpB